MSRPGTIAQALALLVLGYALVVGEPGVVIGVVGAALWAFGIARHASAVLRVTTTSVPATAVRALRRSLGRAAVPRQQDPDAPGHTRARAPSGPFPAV